MSMNPARTVASALPAASWQHVWLYFVAPPLGMLLAAEVYLRTHRSRPVLCCKLHHDNRPGIAGSHGRRVPYAITIREQHPITEGLPPTWTHAADELYAHLRGPGKNMTVLATTFSDPAKAGSGREEPQLMVLGYGKGRIFHTTLGHDVVALGSEYFAVTFQRGVEWAATGGVGR
jgi:hypothetical protein